MARSGYSGRHKLRVNPCRWRRRRDILCVHVYSRYPESRLRRSAHGHFPLNAWYAAAYDVEVRRELLARTICGRKIVLFRRSDGEVAALEDACWHRLLPLSMGRLEDDQVVCGYHGLVYNAQGRCTFMPSQETLNPSACVRSYPVVQKHRFVWVWPGDPALADPALVPDLHWNDDPHWAGDGKLIAVKCDYRLVLDNLMDLTHETFVHGTSIGNHAVAEAPSSPRTATAPRPSRAGWRPSRRRRSGPARSAMRAATPAWSTAGRSSASRRRPPSRSTSAWPPTGSGAVPMGGHPGDRSARRQRLRAQHHHAGDGAQLPLLLGLLPQLLPRRTAAHARAARGRRPHLPRGRAGAGGPASARSTSGPSSPSTT